MSTTSCTYIVSGYFDEHLYIKYPHLTYMTYTYSMSAS